MEDDIDPFDALISYQFGACECGKSASRFTVHGLIPWGVCDDCKTRWNVAGRLDLLKKYYGVTPFDNMEDYREIPGHTPEWVRDAISRQVNRDLREVMEAALDYCFHGCECGQPPDGFVKLGHRLWMTHSGCKTRWLALYVPSWLRMTEDMLRKESPALLQYREITGRSPEEIGRMSEDETA